jgi:protoheme IX farnesyltransferase
MLTRASPVPVALKDLVALTKPRLSAEVLLTCGGGILLAPGRVPAVRAAVALVATSLIVGAANALNCYLERDLDANMRRTRERPLPSGRLDPRAALVLAFALSAIGVPALTFVVNPLTALLGVFAMASYVLVYTPMKQRSPLALWVGAVPGAIPPLMGWTSVTGRVEPAGLALFAILFCWQIPHFIAIGMFRGEDYARAGHKILPLVAGARAAKLHAVLWAVLLVPCTLALYPLGVESRWYVPVALALGVGFVVRVLSGLPAREAQADARWARRVFHDSLMYLTALFVAVSLGAR